MALTARYRRGRNTRRRPAQTRCIGASAAKPRKLYIGGVVCCACAANLRFCTHELCRFVTGPTPAGTKIAPGVRLPLYWSGWGGGGGGGVDEAPRGASPIGHPRGAEGAEARHSKGRRQCLRGRMQRWPYCQKEGRAGPPAYAFSSTEHQPISTSPVPSYLPKERC